MARPFFNRTVNEVTNHDANFRNNIDCTGKEGISSLLKCTSAIRQLAYDVNVDFLNEYLQMSERSSLTGLDHFCQYVMEIFGPGYLRKPTVTDVEKLYRHHEEKHEFPGMLGALIVRIGSGLVVRSPLKSNMLDMIMVPIRSFCWKLLRHKTYGYDMLSLVLLEIPFVANGVIYPWGYYLVDMIYPELATLVKTIPEPADDDHKRILYKLKQESTRKDVKRAFGVLKKKWAILANPARALKKEKIMNMIYTCIILHIMIRKFKEVAISPTWFPEEAHHPDDLERSDEQVRQVMWWIRPAQVLQNLRTNLIEHLSRNV
ncbi:ALP1-like protein [Tanacetum coccineum]